MTCRTCKNWHRGQWFGPITSDGTRKVTHTETLGWCLKIVEHSNTKRKHYPDGNYDIIEPLDRIVCPDSRTENQWGSGGIALPLTGPNFGCIHWENRFVDSTRTGTVAADETR